MRYEEFWKLTPISLSDIVAANVEKLKEEMQIKDICNWQLGQYFYLAQLDAIASAFGKNGHSYPKTPSFSNALKAEDNGKKLSEKQEELETMKFKNFFSHLGDYVSIKKDKGAKNGK